MKSKATTLILMGALILAACGGAGETTSTASGEPTTTAGEAPSTTAGEAPSTTAGEAVTLPSPEVTSVRIGISNLSANGFVSKFAQDLGLYEKYGLESVEVLYFEGAQRNTAALLADQIEVGSDSPETTFLSLTTDQPIIDVAVYGNGFVDCIVAAAGLEEAADLTGQRWAISSPGGQSHAEIVIALEALGIPIEDVEVTQIGGQGDRVAALQAGSVGVIPVECSLADELVEAGMNLILELPEVGIDIVTSNLRMKRSWVEENPNTTLAIVAANLEAMQVLHTDPDTAVESLSAWGQVDPEEAAAAIEDFQIVAQRDLMPTLEGYESVLSVQALENPVVADVDVSQAFTTQFLDQLREMGLNEALGVPSE